MNKSKIFIKPKGHENCQWSTGIHDGLTVGSGKLDHNGYWEKGCHFCAREIEKQFPEYSPVWPFPEKTISANDLKLFQTVYHSDIYNGNEPFQIVGIRENEVELLGDFSGGTYHSNQKCWMNINGILLHKNEPKIIKCPTCNGTGKIIIKGTLHKSLGIMENLSFQIGCFTCNKKGEFTDRRKH